MSSTSFDYALAFHNNHNPTIQPAIDDHDSLAIYSFNIWNI